MDTLKEIINAKGFKLNFVASELNITRKALYKKLRGDSEFKASVKKQRIFFLNNIVN